MTDVIPDGGIASVQNALTGVIRLVTIDTSNLNLRLHDGVTPGGKIILNQTNADARYQAKSSELSGIGGAFLPTQRGFMTRRGPADYRIRKLVEDGNAIGIANPDGHDGNPTFTLKATIIGDRTWDGDVSVTGVMEVLGGINADTSGTHIGAVTGDVVGDLTGNSAGTHTGPQVGDVNVSGHTLVLDDNQIPASKVSGLAGFIVGAGVPVGGIIMWAGSTGSIPGNYLLCDGTGGTPDLRGRFIIGAGGAYSPDDVGGADHHAHSGGSTSTDPIGSLGLSVDGHALSVSELPAHHHNLPLAGSAGVASLALEGVTASGLSQDTADTGGNATHTHGLTQGATGDHDHTVTVADTATLPPYYALAYIMRVA